MGVCTACSTRGVYENSISEFFQNMKLRKETHKNFEIIIKKKWSMGKIPEKNWQILIDEFLEKSVGNLTVEYYKSFWSSVYNLDSLDLLILSMLFLCDTNLLQAKKLFIDMAKINFKKAKLFREGENKTVFFSTEEQSR